MSQSSASETSVGVKLFVHWHQGEWQPWQAEERLLSIPYVAERAMSRLKWEKAKTGMNESGAGRNDWACYIYGDVFLHLTPTQA